MIFDSLTKPIPSVRRDIEVISFNENGKSIIYFHDSLQHIENGFALDAKVEPILSLITGRHSINKIVKMLNGAIDAEQLLQFVQFLDENLILDSDFSRKEIEHHEEKFEASTVRKPALVNQSYPENKDELSKFLNDYLPTNGSEKNAPKKALYAPHIDLRIGKKSYAKAFASLEDIKPKRVVILATAHYTGYYGNLYSKSPFIGSTKNYELPGRIFDTDKNYVESLLQDNAENGFTVKDRAHRIEHSIETHLLLASRYWKHDFSIVPILVSGFDELLYTPDGFLGNQLESFSSTLRSLDDEDTFYLISGDLSHVGKKFGDALPAEQLRSDVEKSDKTFIKASTENNANQLLAHMTSDYDSYRVCGFPPMLTFLKAFPEYKGKELSYEWWDEKERESAVSFSSILY
ncbi:MAG: AmmeMemoRadiSam system protein B [Balneolaceae bacterium]